jgi:8-amino-7-oxononanoate synthase
MNEDFLHKKLEERKAAGAYRSLKLTEGMVDFCSNDYLGIATNNLIRLDENLKHGSAGSRLLAGNYALIENAEKQLATFHEAEAALIFNSGFDANLGLLSCIAQKGDTIIYDALSHASIRDGLRLSFANSFSFAHNDMADLEKKLSLAKGNIFVVTETVFSMDGDMAPMHTLVSLCDRFNANLIVDEAHAIGVIGDQGEGLSQHTQLHKHCFARVYTFGKAMGIHGAAIVGSDALKNYLVNYARSFIYTTALPESSVNAIQKSYELIPSLHKERMHLKELIAQFHHAPLRYTKMQSATAIQGVIVPGNDAVKEVAAQLQKNNFDIRPILYPTVPKGEERLRIVLHAFNTKEEVESMVECLK